MQPPMGARMRAFKQASEGDLTRGKSRFRPGRLIPTRCQPNCHPVSSGGFFLQDSSHRFMLVENNYPIEKKHFPDGVIDRFSRMTDSVALHLRRCLFS
jgi:hypothetical protein